MKLSQNEVDLIFTHYETGDFDWLSKALGKKKNAITEWARKRGLKRKVSSLRKGNLERLLNGTIESFYWLGFYAADGYISKNGHFMLSQSTPEHLYKLASFLETEVKQIKQSKKYSKSNIAYRVAIYDKNIGIQIRKMFNITGKKTYDGISLDFIGSEQKATSFLIGYLDGDGCRTKSCIVCECHKSWLDVFKDLLDRLPFELASECVICLEYKKSHKDTFARLRLRAKAIRFLKDFISENNLPAMQKKWY